MNITVQGQIIKNAYENAFYEIRKKYDLTINEVMLFFYLYKHEDKDTAKDIVDLTVCSKSHISKSVDNLVNRNLIQRVIDLNDKKIIHLKFKAEGIKIAEEINEKNNEINCKILENIPKENLEITKNTIKMIIENVAKI